MAGKVENRIFVGGLSRDVSEKQLRRTFGRFGEVLECQIMAERDTGRPRGFGFITFSDQRAVDEAIREMHGREFGDRQISVNIAQPKMGDVEDPGYRGSGYPPAGKGSYGGAGGGGGRVRDDECFKCGRPGHWARDCPSAGGGRGAPVGALSSRPRFGGSDSRVDRYGDQDRYGYRDRYMNDRYEGGRYGDRDRFDARESYPPRDRYANDRYLPPADRFVSDRYGGPDRFPQNGYGKERPYERDVHVAPRGAGDRYGGAGGPIREDARGYRSRPGPYDRPARGGYPY